MDIEETCKHQACILVDTKKVYDAGLKFVTLGFICGIGHKLDR